MTLNQRIRAVCELKHLRPKELALKAMLSPAEISLLETGRRPNPRVETLQRIAAAFEVSTSFLLGEEDQNLPLPAALSRQSFKLFQQTSRISEKDLEKLERLSNLDTGPQSIEGWGNFYQNHKLISSSFE